MFYADGIKAILVLCSLFASGLISPLGAATAYRPEVADPLEMPWNWSELSDIGNPEHVRCFEVSPDGSLWLGYSEGVARHDGNSLKREMGFDGRGLRRISATADNEIYVTASRTLWRKSEGEWYMFPDILSIPSPSDVGAVQHRDGTVWLAANRGFFLVVGDSLVFAGKVSQDPISAFDIDDRGRFWIVESPSGTARCLERIDGSFRELQSWPNLMNLGTGSREGSNHIVHDLLCAGDGTTWLVNAHPGAVPARIRLGVEAVERHDLKRLGGTNKNGSLSQTSDGFIRVTGAGTIHRFDGEAWRVHQKPSLRQNRGWSYIKEGPDGYVWLLERFIRLCRIDYQGLRWKTLNGLVFKESNEENRWYLSNENTVVREDLQDGSWYSFSQEDGLIEEPSSLAVLNNGTVWVVGSDRGVAAASFWDGLRWHRNVYPELGINVKGIAEDQNRLLLAGRVMRTISNGKASQPGLLIDLSGKIGDKMVDIPLKEVLDIKTLSDGRVLLSGEDIIEMDGEGFKSVLGERRSGLPFKRIQNFEISDNGDVWVANWGGGVVRHSEGEWTRFGLSDGLSSPYVADLLLLKSGQVAALNAKGLDRFDGKSWYSVEVPSLKDVSGVAQLEYSRDGVLWVNIDHSYWTTLVDLRHGEEREFFATRYSPSNAPSETELHLLSRSDQYSRSRLIRWTASALDFEGGARAHTFSYRQNGGKWSAFTSDRSLYLDNLKPGHHKIEARARDEDGNVDPTPAVLEFEVLEVFWETRWFLALSLVAILAILFLVYGLLWQRIRHVAAIDKLRVRFLTNVSHELRSPLTLIMGPLEKLVSLSPIASESRNQAEMALRNAKRLNELVDQLLQLRQAEVGSRKEEKLACDAVEFVRTMASDFDALARTANQRVLFECNVDSAWLELDKDAVRKILDNLVLNSLKHSEEHASTCICLTVTPSDNDRYSIFISVSDEGSGISPNALPRIFDAFYIEKSGALPGVRNYGVGLALVKELVTALGGKIRAESPICLKDGSNGGARFDLVIPNIAACDAIDPERSDSMQGIVETPKSSEDRLMVLVADDQEEIRTYLSQELAADYQVIEAGDGEEAFRRAVESVPDLILADVRMPKMSGIELCRELRSKDSTSHIPVILQTASDESGIRQEGLDTGAVDFLAKPFSLVRLRMKIGNLLRSRQRYAKRMKVKFLNEATSGEVSVENVFIEKVRAILDEHLSDPDFNAAALAQKLALGKSSCYRKFMAVLNSSPSHFIKNYRLERSISMLAAGSTVAEVAVKVAYSDASAFNRAFKNYFGHTPSNYEKVLEQRGTEALGSN